MSKKKKEKLLEKSKARLTGSHVIAESNDTTRELYDKNRYGEPLQNGKFQYALIEALFLIERGIFEVEEKEKIIDYDNFIKKVSKKEKNFWVRYTVYADLRRRGYIVKTAFKFGADFRVYDRGIKPGEDHAKWVVFPVSEGNSLTWFEFSAKNRVAHSTRKKLLLGIVDAEGQVTFYEVRWLRP